ncbi:MAG: hypothetical protein IJN68_04245 [Clostridia bacterium]|nr:hypothetical protein [Clostridia bacterium]
MKDIVKKILVGILAVVIVLGAAIYRFMFYDPNKSDEGETQPTVTDAAGTTYYALTNPDGSMMVVVTNENGEQYKAEFDGQTVGSTVAALQAGEVQGTLPTNYTGPHLDVSATTQNTDSSTTAPSGGSQPAPSTGTTAPQHTPSQTTTPEPSQQAPTQAPTQAPSQQTGNKIDIYQQVFKSGNFLMKIKDPDLGNVTMAMKGNKMYLEAAMEGLSLKLIFNGDKKDKDNPDGTWYLILDSFQKYSTMPADMLGDMNVSEITKGFAQQEENLVYTSDVVDVNGALLVRESTTDINGNTVNYYFDGDVLVKSETISPAGSATSTEFEMITTSVDDSLFQIPSGYGYLNLEWLMKLAGGSVTG